MSQLEEENNEDQKDWEVPPPGRRGRGHRTAAGSSSSRMTYVAVSPKQGR